MVTLFKKAYLKLRFYLNSQTPSKRGPAPLFNEEALGTAKNLPGPGAPFHSFTLYRILGNDLTPRHQPGQTRENLRFILKNEPPLPGCQKYWIVNRIVDPAEEKHIINLLEAHSQPFIHLPFELEEYKKIGYDLAGLPKPRYLVEGKPRWLPKEFRVRLSNRIYRFKNNYVMHNNGARNLALEHGQDKATWVLPWDGNCFLTLQAWASITQAIESKPWYPYWIIPMARTTSHQELLNPHSPPKADQEPQIIFRSGAKERFNPEYYYGRRPKVELLWRLGVPGPWDHWAKEPWDLSIPDYSPQAGQWQQAGWVYRLPSGKNHLEQGKKSETQRLQVRGEAITDFLVNLDAKLLHGQVDLPSLGPTIDSIAQASQVSSFLVDTLRQLGHLARLPSNSTKSAQVFLFKKLTSRWNRNRFKYALNENGNLYWVGYLWLLVRLGHSETLAKELPVLDDRLLWATDQPLTPPLGFLRTFRSSLF